MHPSRLDGLSGLVVRVAFENGQAVVIQGGGPVDVTEPPLYPGANPNAPPEPVGVLENGRFVWKPMRVQPRGPGPGVPAGQVVDGLYRLCGKALIGEHGGKLVQGVPATFSSYNYQLCPVPSGLPDCTSPHAVVQWTEAVEARCSPTFPQPEGLKVAGPVFGHGAGPIDFRALMGKEGRRAKLREAISVMAWRVGGGQLPAPLAQTVDQLLEHFRQNPQALALFWSRYRHAVRHSRWQEKLKASARNFGDYLEVALPYIILTLAVLVTILSGGVAAGALTVPTVAAVSIQLSAVAAQQLATYTWQKKLQEELKAEMTRAAANQQMVENKMVTEMEASIDRMRVLSKQDAMRRLPTEIRTLAQKAAEGGAYPIQVKAMYQLASEVEAYIAEKKDFPGEAWMTQTAGRLLDELQAADRKALAQIDHAMQNVQASSDLQVQEAAVKTTALPPAVGPAPIPETRRVVVRKPPAPAPITTRLGPVALLAAAFFFLTR